MKKTVNIVLIIIVVVFVAAMASRDLDMEMLPWKKSASDNNNFNLSQVADGMNKYLPSMINEVTRLDQVIASDEALIYNFTLVGISKDEIENKNIAAQVKSITLANYCASSEMAELRKNNINLEAKYVDENGQFITGFTVSNSECES